MSGYTISGAEVATAMPVDLAIRLCSADRKLMQRHLGLLKSWWAREGIRTGDLVLGC